MIQPSLEQRIKDVEHFVDTNVKRWKWLRVWIVIFTVAVLFVLYKQHQYANDRVHDRNVQVAQLRKSQIIVCDKALGSITTLLKLAVKNNPKKPTESQKKVIKKLLSAVDPQACNNLPLPDINNNIIIPNTKPDSTTTTTSGN